MIAEGIAAAMKPAETAPAAEATQRSDDAQQTPQGDDVSGKLLASVESVADSVKGLAASMEAMTKRMDTMEGATVVRSDSPDAAASTKRNDDVFAGVFGRRG
jgi:uncharacterized protein YoxC